MIIELAYAKHMNIEKDKEITQNKGEKNKQIREKKDRKEKKNFSILIVPIIFIDEFLFSFFFFFLFCLFFSYFGLLHSRALHVLIL